MSTELLEQRKRRTMRLGKYEDLTRIASGGMGTIYRCQSSEDGKEYALKVLTPELAEKPILLERFKREAEAASRLRHPNIVSVYRMGKTKGTWYIAMEFIEGIDLHRYVLGAGPVKVEETLDILIQAARALEHAHSHEIVHRDIKPSNFLLTRHDGQRRVKLTDFGLAVDRTNPDESKLTKPGTTVGTVDYMSPEQAKGRNLTDCRSDIYALGCTAYFMLTGQPPFPEGSIPEKLYKHVHVSPTDPREVNPAIPDELITILGHMMEKLPENRYQTMTELLDDLAKLRHAHQPQRPNILAMLTNGEVVPEPKTRPFQHLPLHVELHEDEAAPVPPPAWLVVAGVLVFLAVLSLLLMVWFQ
jgi:serine/threonine-protein kinase